MKIENGKLKIMCILAIDTSCDETSVAVTRGRKIIANKIYSQILIHKKWGGVVPSLAKRAHEERIDMVVEEALDSVGDVDYIAVTYGPGLAVALEVGICKAKELAKRYGKKIIPVNHMEGHIYSCFAQNSNGNPARPFLFPYLSLLISGGHTELVLFTNHIEYGVLGRTLDDAAGEALDKAAKILGLGYPGGPAVERLAQRGSANYHRFPRPLERTADLNFSFSGLKTSFYYHIKNMNEREKLDHLYDLARSFQEAVFDSLLNKLKKAIDQTGVKNILVAGGVAVNTHLRKKVRRLIADVGGTVLFPPFPSLYGDNAAMIGIAGYFKAQKNMFADDANQLDRKPRLRL